MTIPLALIASVSLVGGLSNATAGQNSGASRVVQESQKAGLVRMKELGFEAGADMRSLGGWFRDPKTGLAGFWGTGEKRQGEKMVPFYFFSYAARFAGPLDRETLRARLATGDEKADEWIGWLGVDVRGYVELRLGDDGEGASWEKAAGQVRRLEKVLGRPLSPSHDRLSFSFERPALPAGFVVRSLTSSEVSAIAKSYGWPRYEGPFGGSGVTIPLPFGEGGSLDFLVYIYDDAEDGEIFGASRSITVRSDVAPATVEEKGATLAIRKVLPGWEVEWSEGQGITASRRLDLRGGMTVEAVGRLVKELGGQATRVRRRFFAQGAGR